MSSNIVNLALLVKVCTHTCTCVDIKSVHFLRSVAVSLKARLKYLMVLMKVK